MSAEQFVFVVVFAPLFFVSLGCVVRQAKRGES